MNSKIIIALFAALLGAGFLAKKIVKHKIDHYGEN